MKSTLQTLDDWLTHISAQHSAEIVMGLDRVREVWQRMRVNGEIPQAPINITVGGTNGKGSTCAMLESILHVAGYKTGFYSSPHLIRYNERVRLNQQEASDALLIASLEAVEVARMGVDAATPTIPLTYFEYATLSALWCFAKEGVDVAILEVGLGGRLDAVNIVDADVSIVVSVDLDHQQYLGDTIEKIGWEKAHIYRPNRPAIFADTAIPASVMDYAAEIGTKLHVLGRDYRYNKLDVQWTWQGTILGNEVARHSLPVPALRGAYQIKNASAALAALAALADRLPIGQSHVKRGLLEVEWPGRMQVIPGRPAVVLDVAHNPHAARALEDALGTMGFYENTYAVFSMLKDKDIDDVILIIKGRIDHWFIAGLGGPRGATVEEIAEKLSAAGEGAKVSRFTSIENAYAAARERATENDRILGFGSFYTVADLLRLTNRLK
jgi:dihydrofolate synthase / folylpolyglutamate synthase